MEDKAIKNMVATEFVYNYVRDKRTVGVIREYPDRRRVEVAEPIGVIFSLTPITNPTSTVLFKCITAIKTWCRLSRSDAARAAATARLTTSMSITTSTSSA